MTFICVAQWAVVFREPWFKSRPSLKFYLSSFLLLVKLQLACDDQCHFFILHRQFQRNYYFLQTHSLNLRKEENLSFVNILFVDDWRVINKISLSDLTKCPQSGRGRWECLFRAFIVGKKVRVDYFFSKWLLALGERLR